MPDMSAPPPARTSTARRRAVLAGIYGSSGLLGVGSLFGLMKAEAALARRAIGPADARLADPDGVYGAELADSSQEPLQLLVLGDSAAAGYGMVDPLDTPPGLLGSGLAHIAGRAVHVRSQALVGARSAHLAAQLDAAVPPLPDVCVVIVGANDVTHAVRAGAAAADLAAVVRRLIAGGTQVVVGTCPDLGTLTPLQPPLRQLARAWARWLARAQTVAVAETGGRAVSLGSLLGPDFYSAPGELFGDDRFHPSLAGYASISAALLPSVAAALGYVDEDDDAVESGILPVSFAAVRAARVPGTETVGVTVAGERGSGRGRWVRVLQRPRLPMPPLPGWLRDEGRTDRPR